MQFRQIFTQSEQIDQVTIYETCEQQHKDILSK